MDSTTKLDAATARELAVRASVCPSTIQKAAAGIFVRGMAGQRARRALLEAGLMRPSVVASTDVRGRR